MKSKLVEKEMVETVGKKNGEADDFKKYLRDKPTSPYFKIKCLPLFQFKLCTYKSFVDLVCVQFSYMNQLEFVSARQKWGEEKEAFNSPF